MSFRLSFPTRIRIEADFRGSEIYCCLPRAGFGVVGRLRFGVLEFELFGVVGLLYRDPDRRSGNLFGEADLLSDDSLLEMFPENENFPCWWASLGEGDGERPLPTMDGGGVSLIVARIAFLNSCHSSPSSRLHPWYFDLVRTAPCIVSPTGKMYRLWYLGVFITRDC